MVGEEFQGEGILYTKSGKEQDTAKYSSWEEREGARIGPDHSCRSHSQTSPAGLIARIISNRESWGLPNNDVSCRR